MPRVSVIIPAYNAAPYVRAAVESILGQSFRDFECIVIDDGATDGTGEILDAIPDSRLRVVHRENRGVVATRNEAIGLASSWDKSSTTQFSPCVWFRFSHDTTLARSTKFSTHRHHIYF